MRLTTLYDIEVTMIEGWWEQVEGPRPPSREEAEQKVPMQAFKH